MTVTEKIKNKKKLISQTIIKTIIKQTERKQKSNCIFKFINSALTIARSNDYKKLFPDIEEFEFPTEFIKYINEYGVENRKLLSIMDSTNHGQDSGLLRQLCFCTEMMINTDGYPLDNALSR